MESNKPTTIAVINAKGGAGKTTLATNLASFYAMKNLRVVLKDFDPQGSSVEWHRTRPFIYPEISLVDCVTQRSASTLSWQRRTPAGTNVIVLDTPAGVDLYKLLSELRTVQKIVVPVMPSPIDIRASAIFIRELYKFLSSQRIRADVCVVASRAKAGSPLLDSLARIFKNLDIPFLGCIPESQHYIRSAEHGIGVFEMEEAYSDGITHHWKPLLDWLGMVSIEPDKSGKPELFVVDSKPLLAQE